jgi:hypothetical protein
VVEVVTAEAELAVETLEEEVAAAGVEVEGVVVGVGPALQEQGPTTTVGCVRFVAAMVIVHLDPALVRSMELQSRFHHQLELVGRLLSAKTTRIWVFAVLHVIMDIVPLRPAE